MKYPYYAFISYSRRDKVWAEWLHRKLETYRVPRSLVGTPGRDGPIPKTLFPIFRDQDELPLSADLGGSISDALQSSACLIVLCSPAAAKSRWVNQEIQTFKMQGKESRIFAFILSGEPNGSDSPSMADQECFPPALRYRLAPDGSMTTERTEPIGGDLRKNGDGKERSFNKAVAGILGVGYNAIAHRELKRKRAQLMWMGALCFLLMTLAVMVWDYTRTKTAYFRHDTEAFGIPKGFDSLDYDTRQHVNSYYRFESSMNKVRRVFLQNSSGTLLNDDTYYNACEEDVYYKENGDVDYVDLKNLNGQIVAKKLFIEHTLDNRSDIIDVKNSIGQPLSITDFSLSGMDDKNGCVTSVKYEYNDQGLIVHKTYLNPYHGPVCDSLHTWSTRTIYQGSAIKKIVYEGADGTPAPNKNGIQSVQFEANSFGDHTQVIFYGADGKPTHSPDGYAEGRWVCDSWGNDVEETFYDRFGKPILKDGFFKLTIHRDNRGNDIEEDYFGIDGKPVLKLGYSKFQRTCDAHGLTTETRCYGINGEPVVNTYRYFKTTYKYDDRGNRIAMSFFDPEGHPTFSSQGAATFLFQFDARGNSTREDYLGPDGQPVLLGGVAAILSTFGDQDQLLSMTDLGIDGKPTTRDAYSQAQNHYDDRGNLIETDYFGPDGKPVLRTGGYAQVKYSFDDRGNRTETAYFGIHGEAINFNGVSRTDYQFDDSGNDVLESYFDNTSAPAQIDGYCKDRFTYDGSSHKVRSEYLDAYNQPATSRQGWSSMEWVYDRPGNVVQVSFFDIHHNLFSPGGNPARKTFSYDIRGNLIENCFYGADGHLMLNPQMHKVARMTFQYDDLNREIRCDYFGTDEKPILSQEGYSSNVSRYNDRSDLTEAEYFGTKGEPVLQVQGYHLVVDKYDDRDRQIEACYYGNDGKPIETPLNGAKKIFKYDARGNMVEMKFIGKDGEPLEIQHSSKVMIMYSPADKMIEAHLFDKTGKLIRTIK